MFGFQVTKYFLFDFVSYPRVQNEIRNPHRNLESFSTLAYITLMFRLYNQGGEQMFPRQIRRIPNTKKDPYQGFLHLKYLPRGIATKDFA